MTVTPTGASYALPTNVDTTSPLVNPSHSDLHNSTNAAVLDINNRLATLELFLAGLTAPNGTLEQSRMVAHQWVLRGNLVADNVLLLPMIWNLTGRVVQYRAAKVSLMGAADTDVEVDIVNGAALTGPSFDPVTQTSILKTGKIVVPAGQHTSASLGASDFVGDQPIGSYVVAYVKRVGSSTPGSDLVIQLNRYL